MITYQRIQSSNFMPLRKLSKKSVFWTPSRDVFVIVPCSLISTWPVGEVLQLSPARKHYFVNSRISLSSVSALLCRVWLLGAFSKRRFETARSLRVQEDLDRHSYKMSIISKCVFFGGGCGVYMFFEIFLNEDQLWEGFPCQPNLSLDSHPRSLLMDGCWKEPRLCAMQPFVMVMQSPWWPKVCLGSKPTISALWAHKVGS